jgi:hypothetical protein
MDGDGSYEASGQTVRTSYATAGDRTVTVRVTDADGLAATGTLVLRVTPKQTGNGGGGNGGGGSSSGSGGGSDSGGSGGSGSGGSGSGGSGSAEQPAQQPAATPPAASPPAVTPPATAQPTPTPTSGSGPVSGVAGVQRTKARTASGWGAIRARVGKAFFWFRAGPATARVHWDDKAGRLHLRIAKAKLRYGAKTLTATGTATVNGKRVRYTLTLVDGGRRDRVTMRLSTGYRRSGTVVSGGLAVR